MNTPSGSPSDELKVDWSKYQKQLAQSVVDQYAQIAADAENLRQKSRQVMHQIGAVLAGKNANSYGVFRNKTTGTLAVLSNVESLNGAAALKKGTLEECSAFINSQVRVSKLEAPVEVLLGEAEQLTLVFEDAAIQGMDDLSMRMLPVGIFKIMPVRKKET